MKYEVDTDGDVGIELNENNHFYVFLSKEDLKVMLEDIEHYERTGACLRGELRS